MDPKTLARAARYRQLAHAEPDKAKAAILREIADEAERDVLCTVAKIDSISLRHSRGRIWPPYRPAKYPPPAS